MLTEFGKELRILRVQKEENINSMAKKLGISIAYLSSIESGKRPIPSELVDKIIEKYHLNKERSKVLREKEAISSNAINVDLSLVSAEQRKLIFALSRKIKDLTDEECIEILGKIK